MAITVASDRTIVNATGGDAESFTNWTETATWSTGGVIDGDMFLQGSNCIGARASAAAGPAEAAFWSHLTTATNLNLTGFHLYFWIKCITLPSVNTRVKGGVGISISSDAAVALDTTAPWTTLPWRGLVNSKQWFVTGSDFEGTSGWICYVIDPFSTADFSLGTPSMTSVDRIGIRADMLQVVGAGAFKPKNFLWDYMSYQTKLTITTTAGSVAVFEDIFSADGTTANQYGVLRKASGIYLGGGKLVFGTTGQTAVTTFTDTKQVLVWQDFSVASGFYEIQLVGAASFATTVTLGSYSGGLTAGGCTIRGVGLDTRRLIAPVIVGGGTTYVAGDILTVVGGTGTITAQFKVHAVSSGVITAVVMERAGSYSVPPTGTLTVTDARNNSATFTATVAGGSIWTLTASAANQTLNIYGSSLSEMLSAALASTTTWRGNTIVNSGTITASGALIDSCTFQDLRTTTPISASYCVDATTLSTITNCTFVNAATALKWTCDNALNGKIDGTTFISGGTGHAIELIGTATNQTLTNVTFTGYSGTGTDAAIYVNIASGEVVISISGGTTPSIRTAGATVTIQNAVTVKVTVKDAITLSAIDGARVLMEANSVATGTHTGTNDAATLTDSSKSFTTNELVSYRIYNTTDGSDGLITTNTGTIVTATLAGGTGNDWDTSDAYIIVALPALNPVSITRSGVTATVTHRNHGLATGASVVIRGATQDQYNGIFTISNVSANAYDYTMASDPGASATGAPTSTSVILSGLTSSGIVQTTTFNYALNQPTTGKVRKSTTGTKYKTGVITGTITSNGLDTTVLLIIDE